MVHKVCLIGTVSVMQWYLGYEVFSWTTMTELGLGDHKGDIE